MQHIQSIRLCLPAPSTSLVGALACASLLPALAAAQESAVVIDLPLIAGDNYERFEDLIDLDGDGDLDIVGLWDGNDLSTIDRVRTRFNDGAGNFSPGYAHDVTSASPGIGGLVCCNLDGDGLPDFAIRDGNLLALRRGQGTQPPLVYLDHTLPFGAVDFELLDLDGDGDDDLLTNSNQGERWLNQGPGVPLAFAGNFPLNIAPIKAQMQRIDADGQGGPFLCLEGVTSSSTRGVQIRPIVNGQVLTGQVLPMPVDANSVPMFAPGDVDNDGDQDLVAFFDIGKYCLYRRVGPAVFEFAGLFQGGPSTELADINGDGFLDGVCCGGGSPTQTVNGSKSNFELCYGDGTGHFGPAFRIPSLGAHHISGAADVDGDGDVDLVGGRCVYYSRGPLLPPWNRALIAATGGPLAKSYVEAIDASDVDRDQDLDLGLSTTGAVTHDGAGNFAWSASTPPAPPAGFGFLLGPGIPGDFDGDGDTDLLGGVYNGFAFQHMRLLRNNGAGQISDGGQATPTGVKAFFYTSTTDVFVDTQGVYVADLDGDLDQDIASAQIFGSAVAVQLLYNGGLGQFSLGPVLAADRIALARDIDGDGLLDLIGRLQDDWLLFRGLGNGQFAPALVLGEFLFSPQATDQLLVLDFDGDGDQDIVMQVGFRLRLLLQQPGGGFLTDNSTLGFDPLTGQPLGLETHPNLERHWAIGDLDGNGVEDLIAGPLQDCEDGSHVFLFDGQGGFSVRQQILRASLLNDLDGDGDLDTLGPRLHQNRWIQNPGAGERQQYGSSGPLACASKPILGAAGPFRVGGNSLLTVSGVQPGSFGFFTVGLTSSAFPDFPWAGVTAWAWPFAGYVILPTPSGPGQVPGDGFTSLQFPIQPNWPNFGDLYHQAFFIDACSPSLVTGSNGLRIRYAP